MMQSQEVLRRVLRGEGAGTYDWDEIEAALYEIAEARSAESEALLLEVLQFEGKVRLAPDSTAPHAMPPEDLMRAQAAQALGQWDKESGTSKYRDAITRVAEAGRSETLRSICRSAL